MDLDIDGNAALVTASSSGLGSASARALAREGANVVVNGRDEERLAETVSDLREDAAGDVVAQPGDITVREDVEALVERAVEEFGRLDHLVTSTGGPPKLRFGEATDEDWYESFDLLVMSAVWAAREAAPHLRADGGGSVVHVTSRSVKEASAANVLSSSVRMAVAGLGKVLSWEFGPEVRVNVVLPGSVETQRVHDSFDALIERGEIDSYDEGRAARASNVPIERIGDPGEFGDAVAYLCSPRAGYVNGAAIPIEGGSGASTF